MSDSTLTPPADQRRTLRAPLIVLRVKVDEGEKSFFGYARNISRSGLFIPATSPRQPGSRFVVEVRLPAPIDRAVQCTCEVVWQRQFSSKAKHDPGMGLKFVDMPEEIAALIDAWVKNQDQAKKAID
ncbi:PilZ domain-containing protein [Trichloromonas sp.]|uniref:PilZ domain-containing protein n=1 Tax=Trichloromonas sp. TaxID=3069249 RepID=UPI003D8175A8